MSYFFFYHLKIYISSHVYILALAHIPTEAVQVLHLLLEEQIGITCIKEHINNEHTAPQARTVARS